MLIANLAMFPAGAKAAATARKASTTTVKNCIFIWKYVNMLVIRVINFNGRDDGREDDDVLVRHNCNNKRENFDWTR